MRLVQINETIFVNPEYVLAVYWGQQAPVVEVALPGGATHNYEAWTENNGEVTDERKAQIVRALASRLMPPPAGAPLTFGNSWSENWGSRESDA